MKTQFLIRRLVTILFATSAFSIHSLPALSAELPSATAALIQRAGDADDDADRLALLKEVRELPHLESALAGELDNLIGQVDQWIHCQ